MMWHINRKREQTECCYLLLYLFMTLTAHAINEHKTRTVSIVKLFFAIKFIGSFVFNWIILQSLRPVEYFQENKKQKIYRMTGR
jgi:hypothetical protein